MPAEGEEAMSKTITTRRSFLQTSLLAGTAGSAALFGPWKHNRVHAAASDKPIWIGLNHEASGQFANSCQHEGPGTQMALAEFTEDTAARSEGIEWAR